MATYVALIRGIAPSNSHMTNDKLRGVLESLGFGNVTSVISSGNIIFTSPETDVRKLEAQIEAAWPKQLGFNATTIVRNQKQLQDLLDAGPFSGIAHGPTTYQLVTFMQQPTQSSFAIPYQPDGKLFSVVGYSHGAVFTTSDTTRQKTPDVMNWLEKQFGKAISSRTPVTIQRILKKMAAIRPTYKN